MAQPIFVLGIAPTLVQALALGLAEVLKICTGPPLRPDEVPLDGIPSFQCVNLTTQLGSSENLLRVHSISVSMSPKKFKQHQSQYRPLRNSTRY